MGCRVKRSFAAVDIRRAPRRVRHYVGLPPEVSRGRDARTRLPDAAAVVLEEADGAFYLFRFDRDGNELNDTWHMTRDDAEAQIAYEFQDAIGEWSSVPDELTDLGGFVRLQLGAAKGRDA